MKHYKKIFTESGDVDLTGTFSHNFVMQDNRLTQLYAIGDRLHTNEGFPLVKVPLHIAQAVYSYSDSLGKYVQEIYHYDHGSFGKTFAFVLKNIKFAEFDIKKLYEASLEKIRVDRESINLYFKGE